MRHLRFFHQRHRRLAAIVGLATLPVGCTVASIDRILAERGVTECSSSTTAEVPDTTGTSTDSTTSTGSDTSGTLESTSGSTSDDSGSGSTTSDETNSTGEPGPICGNGVLEDGETCDDGNVEPDDGCQACARDSIIFLSSEVYQGFAIGGLIAADLRCRSLAAKAGLPRFETYRAWLSTPTMSAAQRLLHSRGRYVLVNGLVVAADWDALTTQPLLHPIMVDEFSQTHDMVAWTGTLASGDAAPGLDFCGDWDDDSGKTHFGGTGLTAMTDPTWSFFEDALCGFELHLYCVEQ